MAARFRLQHGCNADGDVQRTVRQPIHWMLAPEPRKGAQTMTDRNTVVVHDDGGGSGIGMLLGIIAIIAIVAAIWFFALGPGAGSNSNSSNGGTNVNVGVPTGAPAPSY
jgi:hypothetical protein